MTEYVLTLSCPDRPGIVHSVTRALLDVGGNITESAQFGDRDTNTFALRTVFESDEDETQVRPVLEAAAGRLEGILTLRPTHRHPRVIIMVSRYDHCLLDLLFRQRHGELPIEIALVISNHPDCADLAARYGVPFEHIPVTPETRDAAEVALLQRVEDLDIGFVVLARYMQVLSDRVCDRLPGRIVNIHHSFLPGFKGSRPYHQAHARGVKLIGATAHFVTADLDGGPIIEQDIARVTHADTVEDLISLGRDVERLVLSRAVRHVAEDRVILIGPKTVVFP